MRILVMFDLPTGSKEEKKSYAQFRKFLLEDGYLMEQFSVYSRVTLGRDSLASHIERLKNSLPSSGRITVLTLTERQYENRAVMFCSKGFEPSFSDLGSQMTLVL